MSYYKSDLRKLVFPISLFLTLFVASCFMISKAEAKDREVDCLTRNAFHEAGNQGSSGRLLVNRVVYNRAKLKNKSFCSVIYERSQFSWTRRGGGRIPSNTYQAIRSEVMRFLADPDRVPSGFKSATHYHNTSVRPSWTRRLKSLGRYRAHVFYTAQI